MGHFSEPRQVHRCQWGKAMGGLALPEEDAATWHKHMKVSEPCMLLQHCKSPQNLRAYPTGLAVRIHAIYQQALKLPAFPPLRFAVKIPQDMTASQIFAEMPLNDVWYEANLLPVFEYLYHCKYVRTAFVGNPNQFCMPIHMFVLHYIIWTCPKTPNVCKLPRRIPDDWMVPMKSFRQEFRAEAPCL